jgi:tetratricopeptide (TPR) repeat protein
MTTPPQMNQAATQQWLKAMQQGQEYFQRGMLDDALRVFSAATQSFPGMAEGWGNLGVMQIQAGQLEEAISSLNRAISLNPEMMPAYISIGDALRLTGKLRESTEAFSKAVALQRTPEGLNKLACGLRLAKKKEEAEALYREALLINPEFSLAKVNLATIQIDLERFDQASLYLQALEGSTLSAQERDEVDSTNIALKQYLRLEPAIEKVLRDGELTELYEALQATPEPQLQVDEEIIEGIALYAEKAKQLPSVIDEGDHQLPEDWPLIEALFMIPYVNSVDEYRKVKAELASGKLPEGDLLESIKMEAVVVASDAVQGELCDPVKAELHLRHWHALATEGLAHTFPGQFKMTSNEVAGYESRRRVRPHLVAGTIRHFFKEIYNTLPPGLPRGLVTMMAISDIHPFADGNGRLAQTILNRELGWTSQMPVLFTRDLGIAGGEFVKATRAVRQNTGTFDDVVSVVQKGQRFAREFCAQLTG